MLNDTEKLDIEITRADPVCGMDVSLEKALAKHLFHIYGHKEYIFCSSGCLEDFKKNPRRYISEKIYGEMSGVCELCGKEMRGGRIRLQRLSREKLTNFAVPYAHPYS